MLKPKKLLFFSLTLLLLAFNPLLFAEETVTITTYYPSPYGVYSSLQTDKLGVGDNNGDGSLSSADVPTTAGDVWIKGSVGIGTVGPGAKLEVAGQVKITGGTPAAGQVLTSDATGLATWEPPVGVPAGAVMFFNLAACPSGWTALTSAQGRYLVGLPSGGTLEATVGTALSDQENRPVGQHGHTITDPGHTHTAASETAYGDIGCGGSWRYGSSARADNTGSSLTGITVDSAGTTTGTNAPYLQLLVCQKN